MCEMVLLHAYPHECTCFGEISHVLRHRVCVSIVSACDVFKRVCLCQCVRVCVPYHGSCIAVGSVGSSENKEQMKSASATTARIRTIVKRRPFSAR